MFTLKLQRFGFVALLTLLLPILIAARPVVETRSTGLTFDPQATEISISSSNNPSNFGESVTFTARVTSLGNPVSTGSVTFLINGIPVAGPLSLNGSGETSFTTSTLAADGYSVEAIYDGTLDFATSATSLTQTVRPALATVTLDNLNQNYDGSPRAVTFTTNPSNLSGVFILYNGSLTPPANAGTYTVTAEVQNTNYYIEPTSATLTIFKLNATITLGSLSQTFDGAGKSATATTNPSGLSGVSITYNGSSTLPVNAGTYSVVATLNNPNYQAGSVSGTMTIAKASATLTLSNLNHIYDGAAKSATATTTPAGLTGVSITYNGSATAPTNAGNYNVVATLNNDNYTPVTTNGTLVIEKATATLAFSGLNQVYDGTARAVSVTSTPAGLTGISLTYNGSATPPVNAGSYNVSASLGNNNYNAVTINDTLVVSKAPVTIALSGLSQVYNGTPRNVTVSTNPSEISGLAVTYNGSTAVPVNAGSYAVLVTLTNDNYQAENASGTLVVDKASATLTLGSLTGTYDGQPKSVSVITNPGDLEGVTITYNGSSTSPTNAGSYSVAASLSNPNYSAGNATGTLVINKAVPVVSWNNPADIVFGTPLGTTQLNASTAIPGAFTYTPGSGAILNAGSNQDLTASFTPTDTANYESVSASAKINVSKAVATIALSNLSQTFDGTTRNVSITTTPAELSGVSVTYNGQSTAPTNAGSYNVTAALNHANYTADAANGTLVVAKAAPSFSNLNSPSIVFGTSNASITGKLAAGSVIPGGNVAVTVGNNAAVNAAIQTDGTFSASVPSGTFTVPASPLAINVSFAGNNNFEAANGNSTLSVSKDTTTVVVSSSLNPSYVGDPVTFTVTVTGTSNNRPSGNVEFFNGTTSLGTFALSNGQASLAINNFTEGSSSIRAVYSGDDNFNGSNSSVLNQTVRPPCTYSVTVSNIYYTDGGGTGQITVTTRSDCAWTLSSDSNFVTLSDSSTNNGNGTVTFTVGQLTSGQSRRATLTIAGQTITLFQARNAVTTSAASYAADFVSREGIFTLFGIGMADSTEAAATSPLPTTLSGNVRVVIRDSVGTEYTSPLFYASPTQINYLVPDATALGPASVIVFKGDEVVSISEVEVTRVVPGLFTADSTGRGLVVASAVRVRNNVATYEETARFDSAENKYVAIPVDLGLETDEVFLAVYGTGFRKRNPLGTISATINGVPVEVLYAGAQGGFVGLDQLNVRVPRSLIGAGEVNLNFVVDGKAANTVRITIK